MVSPNLLSLLSLEREGIPSFFSSLLLSLPPPSLRSLSLSTLVILVGVWRYNLLWHWYSSYSSIRGISHAMSIKNISSLPDANNNSLSLLSVWTLYWQNTFTRGEKIDSPIPFDFLIDQTLLRTSLGSYCQQTNTSEEIVLDVEFLPSTLPPQLDSTVPAEDWVSDVDLSVPGCVPFARKKSLFPLCLQSKHSLFSLLRSLLVCVELSCPLLTLELYRYNRPPPPL